MTRVADGFQVVLERTGSSRENVWKVLGCVGLAAGMTLGVRRMMGRALEGYSIKNKSLKAESVPRTTHDERRYETYPALVPNTWYCIADEGEVKQGETLEVRALGQTLVLWKTSGGEYVCQDAYCVHLGANLAVGGVVKDDCIQCPFHHWEFNKKGGIAKIPGNKEPHKCPDKPALRTYKTKAWCGFVFMYFHADGAEPEFELSDELQHQITSEGWRRDQTWDVGHTTLTVIDWVDQAGDHSHFQALHAEFLFPWTVAPIPQWIFRFFPIGIAHTLETFRGDDVQWAKVRKSKYGDKLGHLEWQNLYLTDDAALSWNEKVLDTSKSDTLVEFYGPSIMVFNIPFTIGTFKVFVMTTPAEGGSIMRVRTFVDRRVWSNPLVYSICWVLQGISASQLQSDIDILRNKIRLRKPLVQRCDGPFGRVNTWLKQFYSASSDQVGKCSYVPDW